MNPLLANDLASCHVRELRQLSDQRRRQGLTTASRRHRQSPLRRHIGFRLMEAGLHLVGSAAD
jgi:site-specific recombinase XerC